MIQVHMANNQCPDVSSREIHLEMIGTASPAWHLVTLKQPAVNQNAVVHVNTQLVARTSDASGRAVMDYLWVQHKSPHAAFLLRLNSRISNSSHLLMWRDRGRVGRSQLATRNSRL